MIVNFTGNEVAEAVEYLKNQGIIVEKVGE